MEREARYCTTEDGVSIAYYVVGAGPALLVPPYFVESFSVTDIVPQDDAFISGLATNRKLVAYDVRGTGLSERNVNDLSHDAMVRDVEAVVQAAGLERCSIFADTIAGPRAVAFAAAHPDQVEYLVLYGTFAVGRDVMPEENLRALAVLCRNNWTLGSQTIADLSGRQEFGDALVKAAESFRASTDGETTARLLEEHYASDVTGLLPLVRASTLVIHRRDDAIIPLAAGRRVGAGVPWAGLVPPAPSGPKS